MTYRRTWFSCVLWFLYTALCVVLIAADTKEWLQHFAGIGTISPQIIYVLSIIPAAVLYWLIRSIAAWIRKNRVWKKHAAAILECVVFLLIVAGALFIRIISLNYAAAEIAAFNEMDIRLLPESSMQYYDMAVVTGNGFAAPVDYGISDLYVMLLSTVLSLLGNREVSAIFLEIILQMIGIILVYAATRKLAGRLPACIAALYLAGSKACLGMLDYFGPEWLFFVLYMAGMLITISLVKDYCANSIPKPLAVIGAVGIGTLIGGLTYLDLTAASLLIVVPLVAAGKKVRREKMPGRSSAGMSAAIILTSYLTCAAVWFYAINSFAYVTGADFVGSISDRFRLCYENSYFFTGQKPYFWDIYLIGMLIVPASFLVFEYFRSGKEQNYMPWIALCLLAAPTPLTLYGEHGFGILSLYIWAVLAGLGLQNTVFGGSAKVMKAMIEEINIAAEKTEETAQFNQTADTETPKEKKMENQTVKPQYIENPLPLPKRHEKREMDYQYDVTEKDMKYDFEVPLNDDFDVK